MSETAFGLYLWPLIHDPIIWVKNPELRTTIILSAFIVACLIYHLVNNLKSNLPPGPSGLPFVGYMPFLKQNVYLQFLKLSKKYGDVFSLKLGSQPVLVLNSAEVIKEVMVRSEFQGRSPNSIFKTVERESPFFASENHIWNEHRKFVVQSMKDLGLGKSKLEEQVQEEIDYFLELLRNSKGSPVDLEMPLTKSVSNTICVLVFNERYEYDDPERERLFANMHALAKVLSQTSTQAFFPWLRKMPFINWYMNIEGGRRAARATREIFMKKIEQHEKTLDPKNIRDIIDMYLVEMKDRNDKDQDTTLSVNRLVGSVADLFGAGTITVKIALMWCVYVIAAFQEVQKKVHKEIEDRLGLDRKPEFRDSKMMPYTSAVLLEIMRWKTMIPIPFLRYTTRDTTVKGYDIPKGTTVMENIYNAHNDPKIWSEPKSFKPERFLSEDGMSVKKSPNFIPFSVGKRACPGENLANMEIFLYFVSMLQKFNISFPKGVKPTFEAKFTVAYSLEPYKVEFTPRK